MAPPTAHSYVASAYSRHQTAIRIRWTQQIPTYRANTHQQILQTAAERGDPCKSRSGEL